MSINKKKQITKVALITGGGKRLGKRIALELAGNGFDVIVNYKTSKKEAAKTVKEIIKFTGKRAISVKADVTKPLQVRDMIKKSLEIFGHIDLLVNNSAVFYPGTLKNTSEKIWDATIDTNLKGTFLCSQEVSKHMLKRKAGQIINIASLGGIKPFAKHIPYSVSKAGVIMLTKCLAKSLAPHIMVNAIAPGTINLEGEYFQKEESIPLKNFAESADITDMIIFLALKNKHITGQVISIDGGYSIV